MGFPVQSADFLIFDPTWFSDRSGCNLAGCMEPRKGMKKERILHQISPLLAP
jgi:hypothetical protein